MSSAMTRHILGWILTPHGMRGTRLSAGIPSKQALTVRPTRRASSQHVQLGGMQRLPMTSETLHIFDACTGARAAYSCQGPTCNSRPGQQEAQPIRGQYISERSSCSSGELQQTVWSPLTSCLAPSPRRCRLVTLMFVGCLLPKIDCFEGAGTLHRWPRFTDGHVLYKACLQGQLAWEASASALLSWVEFRELPCMQADSGGCACLAVPVALRLQGAAA